MIQHINSKTSAETKDKFFTIWLRLGFHWLTRLFLDSKIAMEKLKDIPKTNYDLGVFHMEKGNIDDAILRFRIVLYFKPNMENALFNLALCYFENDEKAKCLRYLNKAEAINPDIEGLDFLKAKLENKTEPKKIPNFYLISEFNQFAQHYDSTMLDREKYNAHLEVAIVVQAIAKKRKSPPSILDLGSGTGFVSQAIKNLDIATDRVIGVDFASEMKFEATQKLDKNFLPLYNNIHTYDIYEYLNDRELNEGSNYAIIIASMAFCYRTNIETALKDCKNLLDKNGSLIITLPASKNAKEVKFSNDNDYFLFGKDYFKTIAKEAGFSAIEINDIQISENQAGFLAILTN